MRLRNYENTFFVKILIFILVTLELLFIMFLINYKFYTYKNMTCIVMNKNICLLVIEKNDKKILYKNSSLSLNDKKIKYKIITDDNVVITKGEDKYYEVTIKFKFNKNYKTNDTLNLVFNDEKEEIIKIFNIIWEGDSN